MSENFDVHARLSATDEASPVIRGLLSNLKQLESISKRLSASFNIVGKSGATALEQFNRASKAAANSMNGIANQSRSASRSFSENWRRATDQRLSDSRRMYSALGRMESEYARQIEQRIAAERRAERAAGRGIRSSVGGGRIPRPSARSIAYGGLAAGAGIGSALRQRMQVQSAEVRAQMFGDLSKLEVADLRKRYANAAGIKYGVGTTKALDVATEALKAGVARQFAGQFGELILKAQAGLDVDTAATAKLAGRLATLQGGFNYARMKSVMNAAAVANNLTAADGNEIIEATRRSLSALSSTRMTPEQLTGLNATGISLGIQPFKMGTFTSFLTSELASASSARGQRAKDLNAAANTLGFGGRSGIANAMRNNPLETIQRILDGLAKLPDQIRAKVARQIGMREWSDELLSLVLGRDKLREVQEGIKTKSGFLDSVALKKIQSLQGRWASISAAGGLLWEKVGAGFDSMFTEISDAILRHADSFNWDSIRNHVAGFVDGLKDGFSIRDWGEVIDGIASWFTPGSIKKWNAFGQGLAEGIGEFATGLKYTFKALSFLSAGDSDAKGMGKTIARVGGFIIALSLLTPVVGTLFAFGGALRLLAASPIGRIAVGLSALAIGLHKVLSYVSDKIFSVFVSIVDGVKSVALSIINTVRGWIGLAPVGGGAGGGASGSWSPRNGSSPGASGGWSSTASKAKASFIKPSDIMPDTSGITGGTLSRAKFESTFKGTALEGKYDAIVVTAKGNNVPADLFAAVVAHETGRGRNVKGNNIAGVMDSETGFRTKKGYATLDDGIAAAGRVVGSNYRKAGGDIDKMGARYAPIGAANDPAGLNKNWAGGVRSFRNSMSDGAVGILGQNPVDIASRYLGKNEYRDRAELAAFVHHDVAGRANAWCARFVNESLRQTGIAGTGSAVANSFQRFGKGINPADVQKGDVLVQPNGHGPNEPGGHVGMATGRTRMNNGQLEVEMISGNDGDQVRTSWRKSNRLMARRAISNVPSPAEVVANVPQSDASVTRGILEKNGSALLSGGGNRGNVAININGNAHDPEALANLVQRRVDESMNWRTHDVSTEYS